MKMSVLSVRKCVHAMPNMAGVSFGAPKKCLVWLLRRGWTGKQEDAGGGVSIGRAQAASSRGQTRPSNALNTCQKKAI